MKASFNCCLVLFVCVVSLSAGCNQETTFDVPKPDSTNEPIVEMEEDTNGETAAEPAAELSLSQALKSVTDGNAVLVDVRSDGEWDKSHFAQAQHISIDKINDDAAAASAGLDKDKLVLLHCGSGGRAGRAAKTLKELGFKVQALETKYDTIKEAGFKEAE